MRKVYHWIVYHPKLVITVFMAALIVSVLCQPLVAVNYDMNDYLPPGSASTLALNALGEEFEGGIPNARVMIRDVSIAGALAYKRQLEAIEGVSAVTWLDDVADITTPLPMQDQDTLETYYRDRNALFTVTIEEEFILPAVDVIRELIGDENAMGGAAVNTVVATTSTTTEIRTIAVFAVIFVCFILALTTSSWMEPVIVMASLGTAILINMGTNIIFGEISFISNAAGAILQLAVSLDYSVFLIHRYEDCQASIPDKREAMVSALCKSTMFILSSGLTTVIGFLALCLMEFQIGPDLGLVLAKGVAISLVTVFAFSPVLTLTFSDKMEKTRHRAFMPSFEKFGRVMYRVMIPAVAVFLLLVVPAHKASGSNSYYYGSAHIFGPSTQLGADTQAIEDAFGKSDTYVLMVPRGDVTRERALSDRLQELPEVTSVLSYVDAASAVIPTGYLDEDTLSLLMSEHYSRMVISVKADYEGAKTFDLIDRVEAVAESVYPGAWLLAGEGVSTRDLMRTVTADMGKVNGIAIGAVFLVLLLSLKSISLPVILVMAIETAIWINMAIPYFSGQVIFYLAYLIISSVQLGATVDYAILLTDRYLECRQTMGKRDAVIHTVSAVTVSVLTSGLTLTVVGFLLGYLSSHGLLSQLGMFLGKGTLLSMTVVLAVLPGMLCLLDGVIRRTSLGLKLAPAGAAAPCNPPEDPFAAPVPTTAEASALPAEEPPEDAASQPEPVPQPEKPSPPEAKPEPTPEETPPEEAAYVGRHAAETGREGETAVVSPSLCQAENALLRRQVDDLQHEVDALRRTLKMYEAFAMFLVEQSGRLHPKD